MLGLVLLALIGIVALTQGIADPAPVPAQAAPTPTSSSTPAILEAAEKDNSLIYRADTPKGVWNGWGFASPPSPNSVKEPAPAPEQFDIFQNEAGEPRTFSGKIVGVESMQGVEIGLISMVGIYWNVKDAYQWEPVAADGSFSITDARYNNAGKILVMRGPNTAWTFLRYNFKPEESGRNIVLHAAPSKKVRLTASGEDMKNLTKVWVEGFDAQTQYDDKGNGLRRQHHG